MIKVKREKESEQVILEIKREREKLLEEITKLQQSIQELNINVEG